MKKTKKYTVICALLLLLIGAAVLGVKFWKRFTPSKVHCPVNEFYPVATGEARLIFGTAEYEQNALYEDNMAYLPMELIKKRVSKDFFYDEYDGAVTFVTPLEINRTYLDEKCFYKNGEKTELSAAAALLRKENVYLSCEFLALFCDFSYRIFEEPSRVIIQTGTENVMCINTKKAAALRTKPDRKADILKDLPENTLLYYVGSAKETDGPYEKVMTEDGIYGYVRGKDLTETHAETQLSTFTPWVYEHLLATKPVVMGWHQVTNTSANNGLSELIKKTENMNVISPTWFRLDSEDGTLSSIADEAYVKRAKEAGLAVWGLFDNFKSDVSTFAVLSKISARERLENEMLQAAEQYDLDGINVDFEQLSLETGPYFIQFLRELSTKCREKKLVLSVDNYVPTPAGAYYDMKNQGKYVDYVVIMAYDEHYAGSEEPGSVASYGYLAQAIEDTKKLVPDNQIIMAVPFYTRLWTISSKGLSSIALGMQAAATELSRNKAEKEWKPATRQYYAEYKKGDETNLIWLEEKDSLREKLLCIKEAGLAGVAAWRIGLETPDVWELFDFEKLAPLETTN